jgi:pimeloyl-ACP methyl ester carboxylesterase
MLFVLLAGYGDTKKAWAKSPLLTGLKKIGTVMFADDITGDSIDLANYCAILHDKITATKQQRVVLVAHSIGVHIAWIYAKKYRTTAIISLDGSMVGKYVIDAVDKVLKNADAPKLLVSFVKQAPVSAKSYPVMCWSYRNIDLSSDSRIANSKNAIDEAKNIKNLTTKFFVSNHYLHYDKAICSVILHDIKEGLGVK